MLFDRIPGLAIAPMSILFPLGCVLALPLILPAIGIVAEIITGSSTPRSSSALATIGPWPVDDTGPTTRAVPPRATAQAATFAACPPDANEMPAGVSSSGTSPSGTSTITSSITSPTHTTLPVIHLPCPSSRPSPAQCPA